MQFKENGSIYIVLRHVRVTFVREVNCVMQRKEVEVLILHVRMIEALILCMS